MTKRVIRRCFCSKALRYHPRCQGCHILVGLGHKVVDIGLCPPCLGKAASRGRVFVKNGPKVKPGAIGVFHHKRTGGAQRRHIFCENCGQITERKTVRKRFCSDRCRHAALVARGGVDTVGSMRRYRAKHPDRVREVTARYNAKTGVRRRLRDRLYYRRNRDVILAKQKAHYYSNRHTMPSADEILQAVQRVVPAGLSEQVRADVCQDLVVGIFAGDFHLSDIESTAPKYVKRVLRQFANKYGPLSLDAPAFGMGDVDGKTLGETLSESEL